MMSREIIPPQSGVEEPPPRRSSFLSFVKRRSSGGGEETAAAEEEPTGAEERRGGRRSSVADIFEEGARRASTSARRASVSARASITSAIQSYEDIVVAAIGPGFNSVNTAHAYTTWSTEQMQEYLVSQDIEVRESDTLKHGDWVAIMEDRFPDGSVANEKPDPLTDDEKSARLAAALRVQSAWFMRQAEKKKREVWAHLDGHAQEDGFLADNPMLSPRGIKSAAQRSALSEHTPWEKPRVKLALRNVDHHHLRHPDGGRFPMKSTTTGRFCLLGGCGEQLDLWDEGKISELSPYGAGVSAYFKLLKYCGWLFVYLSVMYFPVLWINMAGSAVLYDSFTDQLAYTTIGNLGKNATTVLLPFCDETEYDSCELDKERVGVYFGWTTAISVLVVFASYFWVWRFIEEEYKEVKRKTVMATDYTIQVPRLPKKERISELELAAHFSALTGCAVSEVSIGRDNRAAIAHYGKAGKLHKERARLMDKLRLYNTVNKSKHTEEAKTKIRDKRTQLSRQIIDKMAEAKRLKLDDDHHATPVTAYITFEMEQGALNAIASYRVSIFRWLCMKPQLRFKGHRISARRAPPPTTILWENLGYRGWEVFWRRSATMSLAVGLLLSSMYMTFEALEYQANVQTEGGESECPAAWSDYSNAEKLEAVNEDDTILHCYCASKSLTSLSGTSDVCYSYVKALLLSVLLTTMSSFMVVFVNVCFSKLLRVIAPFEKQTSLNFMELSIFQRSLVLKLINTAVSSLIAYSTIITAIFGVNLANDGVTFSISWYRSSGAALMLTMAMNTFIPHAAVTFNFLLRLRGWTKKWASAVSQEELNRLAMGISWDVSARYTDIGMIFTVCLMYSPGIPVLLPFAAIAFFTFFWVEKFMFFHIYRIPPQYSSDVILGLLSLMPYLLLLEVLVGVWMYGNGQIFETSDEHPGGIHTYFAYGPSVFTDKFRSPASRPLLLPFLVLLGYILYTWFWRPVTALLGKLFQLFGWGAGNTLLRKLEAEKNDVQIPFGRAVVRDLMKGLASYNILLNPKYREAFGLSEAFAYKHGRVGSISKMLCERPSVVEMMRVIGMSAATEGDDKQSSAGVNGSGHGSVDGGNGGGQEGADTFALEAGQLLVTIGEEGEEGEGDATAGDDGHEDDNNSTSSTSSTSKHRGAPDGSGDEQQQQQQQQQGEQQVGWAEEAILAAR